MKDMILSKYIARNHMGTAFSNAELKAVREGDVEKMVDTFFDIDGDYNRGQIQSTFDSLNSFIGKNIELTALDYQKEYSGPFVGCQVMDGDVDVFMGVAGEDKDLLALASVYCMDDLKEFDEDAYDALCEFINVVNGKFATKLGEENVDVTMHPPVFYKNTRVMADSGVYVATFAMNNYSFKILMAADDRVSLVA